jgi:hypothetical protein
MCLLEVEDNVLSQLYLLVGSWQNEPHMGYYQSTKGSTKQATFTARELRINIQEDLYSDIH